MAKRRFALHASIAFVTPLAGLIPAAPAQAEGCILDLQGKKYVTLGTGRNLILNLVQDVDRLSGSAEWVDEHWLRVRGRALVTGSLSFDTVNLTVVWRDPPGEPEIHLHGVLKPEGFESQISSKAMTVPFPRWDFATEPKCVAFAIGKPRLELVSRASIAQTFDNHLEFSVQTGGPVDGRFYIYVDGELADRADAEGMTGGGYHGRALVRAEAEKPITACFRPRNGAEKCSDPLVPINPRNADFLARQRATEIPPASAPAPRGSFQAAIDAADKRAANGAERTAGSTGGGMPCRSGYVWREARAGDTVCVTPASRSRAAQENGLAAQRRDPGSAYGPNGCKPGFVWREALRGDLVCVTPEIRALVAEENRLAGSRTAR